MMRTRGRRPHHMQPKPRLLIVCEGRKTEPNYFEGFRRENRDLIISIIESPGKTPIQIVRHAMQRARDLDIGKVEGDAAWCVFDVDECEAKDMRKAIEQAGNKLKLAISNPCFEVWFLLHFTYTEKRMDTCKDVIAELKRNMPGYDKAADHFGRLRSMTQTAVTNAERLERGRIGMGLEGFERGANPCTHVHHLVNTIVGIEGRSKKW